MFAPRRILVLRGGAIGDFIVTLPALAQLRARWPRVRIELCGNATAAEIGVKAGVIDAVHSQHERRWAALYESSPLPESLATFLRAFDLVVSFWPDANGELRRHFPLRSEQVFISSDATPQTSPAAAHFCQALSALDLPAPDFCFKLGRGNSGRSERTTPASEPLGRRRIAVHPGSGSPRKNWPMDRWHELVKWLRAEVAADVLVISGEAEPPDQLPPGKTLRGWPLTELAARLAECALFIGHDSGISHLAAAAGARCVLLFGPTDPAIWAPPCPLVQVIQRGTEMGTISVEDVKDAIARLVR